MLSHVLYLLGSSVTYETFDLETDQLVSNTVAVNSLLTADGIRFLFTSMIRNFMGFGPVGVILVAMIGVGLAEQAGLVTALIKKIVSVAPAWSLTYIIVGVGVLSSIAADAGYLVLIPWVLPPSSPSGAIRSRASPPPSPAWPRVFLVNVFIVPTDGILTEITNDAIHLLDPNVSIDLAANLYFSIASACCSPSSACWSPSAWSSPGSAPTTVARPDQAEACALVRGGQGPALGALGLPGRRRR